MTTLNIVPDTSDFTRSTAKALCKVNSVQMDNPNTVSYSPSDEPFLIHNSSPASDKAPSTNGFDAQFCAQEKSPDSGVVADGDTDTDSTTALEFDRRKSLSEDKPANEKDSADKCADAAAADEDDYEEDNGFISPTSINDHYFTFPRFDRKRRFFDIHAISNCDDQFQKSLAEATERRRCAQIAMKRKRLSLTCGIGEYVSRIRCEESSPSEEPQQEEDLTNDTDRERIVLDKFGRKVDSSETNDATTCMQRTWRYSQEILQYSGEHSNTANTSSRMCDDNRFNDLPAPPPHPTDPEQIRRLIRSKMVRCKKCGSRFIEKNILERHLRDNHPIEYVAFLKQQEDEINEQRLAEIEANRIEELASGGFIPPEDAIAANSFDVELKDIPLPGELSGGKPARFDGQGFLRQPKRIFRKKISPQCPFCDKRFRNEVSLKKHFKKKHPDSLEFTQCLKCFKAIPSEDKLPTHQCDLSYVCFECTPIRNLCTQRRLYFHRSKFHRGANSGFKCNLCTMKFLTPRKLRKHKKMAHVFTRTYQCHFCEELFTSECSVITHERIHTGIIKFECRICDYKCNRFINMEQHQREEHGYICSVCHTKLAEWSELKNHTLQEHGGYLTIESNTGYVESPRVWLMYKGE